MRTIELRLPELAFVAGTRGIIGVGIGLLISEQLRPEMRKAVGWTLLGIGALTTVPIAASLFGRSRLVPATARYSDARE
jgi:hypothetical protein